MKAINFVFYVSFFRSFAAIRLVIVTFSGTLKLYVTRSVAFVMFDDRFCFLITTQKLEKC